MKKLKWIAIYILFASQLSAQELLTDPRDGKVYKTTRIGHKVWMADNLAYQPANDTEINIPPNVAEYGYLYNWLSAKKVCPSGWHLPTKNEWSELVQAAGGVGAAGKQLMSNTGWEGNRGTNTVGFNAKPAGYWDVFDTEFRGYGKYGNWWTSTVMPDSDEHMAWIYSLEYTNDSITSSDLYTIMRYSVRCVKNSK